MEFGSRTAMEWDAIALAGEPFATLGGGYTVAADSDIESVDYSARRIASGGCGNQGRYVLVGKTPRGRALVRQGKIQRLVAAGVRQDVAAAAASMQYGMEIAPFASALANLADKAGDGVLRDTTGRSDFERLTGLETAGLSMPRVWAAVAIARRALGLDNAQPTSGNGWSLVSA